MNQLLLQVGTEYAKSIQTNIGRTNIDKGTFVNYLKKFANKRGIKNITKLPCYQIDALLIIAQQPSSKHIINYF